MFGLAAHSGGLVLGTSGYLEMGCCCDLVGCWVALVLDTFSTFLGRVYIPDMFSNSVGLSHFDSNRTHFSTDCLSNASYGHEILFVPANS